MRPLFFGEDIMFFCHSICETHDQNNCTRSFVQKSALILCVASARGDTRTKLQNRVNSPTTRIKTDTANADVRPAAATKS